MPSLLAICPWPITKIRKSSLNVPTSKVLCIKASWSAPNLCESTLLCGLSVCLNNQKSNPLHSSRSWLAISAPLCRFDTHRCMCIHFRQGLIIAYCLLSQRKHSTNYQELLETMLIAHSFWRRTLRGPFSIALCASAQGLRALPGVQSSSDQPSFCWVAPRR